MHLLQDVTFSATVSEVLFKNEAALVCVVHIIRLNISKVCPGHVLRPTYTSTPYELRENLNIFRIVIIFII